MSEKRAATTQQDFVTRLSSAGEDAVQRLADLPGGKALVDTAASLRDRLDELAARIRAIDPLERRVTALEQRLDVLEKKPASRAAPKPKAAAKPKTD